MNEFSIALFTATDVHQALFDMHSIKASGPNGFHAAFLSENLKCGWKYCSLTPASEFLMTAHLWRGGTTLLLALFQKLSLLKRYLIFDLLVYAIYKIVTKAIVNRLKNVLYEVISLS
ncbi:hypothetical protein L484_026033 [Morus notabilis]|uniref:Uncharacterized protein n=1 Tax=Morus notabilis TaxID=981085 RepID=W9R7U8_9ROSA|nr:hypothetical protein L484_026033 [Morus notabilis]